MKYAESIMISWTWFRICRYRRDFIKAMIKIAPEKLKAGMILAKTVYNHQELLLLEAGTKLMEKNIRMFKSWGVSSVWVKGNSPGDTTRNKTSKAESAASIEVELNQKFADVIDDPVMAAIKQAAGRVLSKNLEAQDEAE